MNTQQASILFVLYFFMALAVPLMVLRCYTRFRLLGSFGVDDALAICSLAVTVVSTATITLGVENGVGVHIGELTFETLLEGLKWVKISTIFYIIGTCTTKLVISTMLLRLVIARRHTWILWISIMLNVAVCIFVFCIYLFGCHPISYAWRQYDPRVKGHCLKKSWLSGVGYSFSGFSIALDLLYAILPGFMFWDLQMETKKKIMLISLMSSGFIAAIANIIRLKYLIRITNTLDPLFVVVPILVWSAVELGLTLCIGCIITLRPLLRQHGLIFGYSGSQPRSKNTKSSKNSTPRPRPHLGMDTSYSEYPLESIRRPPREGRTSDSSKELILGEIQAHRPGTGVSGEV